MSFSDWTKDTARKANEKELLAFIRWCDRNSCIALWDADEFCGDCHSYHSSLTRDELLHIVLVMMEDA